MNNRLSGKRVAVFIEDYFEDSELLEPLKFLIEHGASVTMVGPGRKTEFNGKKGAIISADVNISDVRITDFDAIVVPGGFAPDKMRQSDAMIRFLSDADDHGIVIAAICHGPQLLISAEIVRGRMITGFRTIAVDLRNAGAHFIDDAVVVDGNLITSRTPDDLPYFNEAIANSLVHRGNTSRENLVAGA